MSGTLNELVRKQILAEGPDLASIRLYTSQNAYVDECTNYVDEQLNSMSRVELLERISDALAQLRPSLPSLAELSARLGI